MRCGEIWMIDLNPTRGDEIQKTRPAVIVNDDLVGTLALKIIVPITDWKDHYAKVDWMARLEPSQENGLIKTSAADTFRFVPSHRLVLCVDWAR